MPQRKVLEVAADAFDIGRAANRHARIRIDYAWQGRPDHLALPVTVVERGRGPTVLVTGGTHGDEVEGQAVAAHLARTLSAEDVRGRVVIVPWHNLPACRALSRTGPVDGIDINRIYGAAEGDGPTRAIARFVATRLMPAADLYLDLHTGGRAFRFVLSSNLQGRPGTAEVARDLPALLAMDAPYALVFDEATGGGEAMPHRGTTEAYMRALGRPAFSSEYGGGFMTAQSFGTALRGAVGLLRHVGVLAGEPVRAADSRSVLLWMRGGEHYVPAPGGLVLVPRVEPGATVARGDLIGEVLDEDPAAPATEIRATASGVVVAIATTCPGAGEPAFMIAEPYPA